MSMQQEVKRVIKMVTDTVEKVNARKDAALQKLETIVQEHSLRSEKIDELREHVEESIRIGTC